MSAAERSSSNRADARAGAADQSRPVARASAGVGEGSLDLVGGRVVPPARVGFGPVAIAQVCHEANRALQLLLGEDGVSPHWYEAPAWQTQSAVEGVLEALQGATPEQLHDAWVDSKLDAGWRYGEAKDPAAMTHPCLVPYADLPAEQRAKDALFHAIVRALR